MADKPAKRFRVGFVEAAIWKNEGTGDRSFYSVTLRRSYKDNDGEWQTADSLGHADLLNAAKALERAELWISNQ